jgi:hypothetical protein
MLGGYGKWRRRRRQKRKRERLRGAPSFFCRFYASEDGGRGDVNVNCECGGGGKKEGRRKKKG